jgi:hypothetical protein
MERNLPGNGAIAENSFGRVAGLALAGEPAQASLAARFSGAGRHCLRLEKIATLERHSLGEAL